MEINTEKRAIPENPNIAIYFRYPKTPTDESTIRQRIDTMTSAVAGGRNWKMAGVYTDIGAPTDMDNPFPAFERMRQDYKDGKFDILLTEPPHHSYRELDAGMDYLLELREIGAHVIFTNGQTMSELLAISLFRSTMKALALVEAMAVQELASLNDENEDEGQEQGENASEQPTMQF